jgi:hypothetical protein
MHPPSHGLTLQPCRGGVGAQMKAENMNATEVKNPMRDLDTFTLAYIEAALWSSTDDAGEPLDANYSWTDLAPEALQRMMDDCAKFQAEHGELIGAPLREAGHCFWLSRNGHGSGFFDSGFWDDDTREKLQDIARAWRECNLYVGDDGKLYL